MPTTKRPVYYSVYCVYSNLKHLLACQHFWIFYVTSKLTLYECVVNVYIQRSFLIRNWTTLGKIQDGGQDGDHFWWRHSPMAAPPPRKYSWFVTTWQGGHVGGQYNRIFSRRIYMKTEFSSQRREILLFLPANMAAVSSRANQQFRSSKNSHF